MKRRSSRSRGAVAVEAALVTPVLLLLVFGIIEMALLMKDHLAVTSLVRQGGRTASAALADYRGQSTNPSPYCIAPTCSYGQAPQLADVTAMAIARAGAALNKDEIKKIYIYKATSDGYIRGSSASNRWGSCTLDCVVYKWNAASNAFAFASGSWYADDINACANNSDTGTLDAVGVYLDAHHDFLTGFFSHGLDLSDHSVFVFEPLEPIVCMASLG